MGKQVKKLPPALKHGAYSSMTLLPGEDEAAFNKLRDFFRTDLAPVGPLEEDIVETVTGLVWRKRNLSTCHKVQHALYRCEAIRSKAIESALVSIAPTFLDESNREKIRAAKQAAEEEARKELGDEAMALVEMGATTGHIIEVLNVVDRIEAAIDRCLKRLLMVRGAKSMALSPHPLTPVVMEERDGVVHRYIEE